MTPRRLVLLTNQYPYTAGDHAFVQNEIDALAAEFDEVRVFNYCPPRAEPLAELPRNVSYAGNLYGAAATTKIAGLLRPSALANLFAAFFGEVKAGALRGHVKSFFSGAAVGMTVANDPRLRAALDASAGSTTVYSFWGMGAGLAIPWLRPGLAGVFVRLHGYDLYEELSGYLPLRSAIFQRVNGILTVSDKGKSYLEQRYSDAGFSSKVVVRRLGSRNHGSRELRGAAPDSTERVVVSCSNVIELKRVDRIAEALALLAPKQPLRWVHFGGGPLEGELRRKAEMLQGDNLAIELRGAVPHPEIMKFYESLPVSVFVNVSTTEGVPVSIMEAISFGVPVVATDVGGTAEIVGPELQTGVLIPSDFANAQLADAVAEILLAPPGTFNPKATWHRLYDAETNSAATAAYIGQIVP
ncbi:MAG: glycosyltransferase [Specibacter sp.]